MGWFGTGARDGDDGMDLRDEIFYTYGIEQEDSEFSPNGYNYSNEQISEILDQNQDKIYDWLRDYDWSKRYNPRFIQEVYIQATAQLFLDYRVKISKRGKLVMLDFIKNDHCALRDKERAESMDFLYKEVQEVQEN